MEGWQSGLLRFVGNEVGGVTAAPWVQIPYLPPIGLWCNGNTLGSDPRIQGSNPCRPANINILL